jgi:hypothetical protein
MSKIIGKPVDLFIKPVEWGVGGEPDKAPDRTSSAQSSGIAVAINSPFHFLIMERLESSEMALALICV